MELFYFEWFRVIRKRFDGIWLVDTIWKSFPAIAPFLIWEQWTGFQSWLLSIFSSISIELDRFFCGRDSDFEEPNQSIESNRFDRLEKVLPAFPFFGATVILHFFSKLFLSFLCCCWKKSFPSLNTIGFLSDFFRFNQNSPYSSFGVYSSRISFIGLDFTEFRGPFFYWKKKKRKVDWSSLTATYFSSIFMNMQSKFFAVDGADFFSMATPFLNAVLFFFFLWWTFVLIFIFFVQPRRSTKKRPPKTGKPNKNKNETTPSRRRADKRRKSEKERKKERKKERIIPQILELSPRCRARRAPDGRRHVTEMKNQKKTPKNHQKTRKCGSYRVFLPSFSDTATEGLRKKRSPPLETHFR